MFGDFNGQIKLRTKQKFKFLSATYLWKGVMWDGLDKDDKDKVVGLKYQVFIRRMLHEGFV